MEELSLYEELLEVSGARLNIRLEGVNRNTPSPKIYISPAGTSSISKDTLDEISMLVNKHGAHLNLKAMGIIEIYY